MHAPSLRHKVLEGGNAGCSAVTQRTSMPLAHTPVWVSQEKSVHALQGVMLSHSAVIAEVAGIQAFLRQLEGVTSITEDDVMLSYLPLAHVFDRQAGGILCTKEVSRSC